MSNPSTAEPSTRNDAVPSNEVPIAMPAPPKPAMLPLTLVLAATPTLGIGQAGTLPWPQLKKEMGYFARVTKRVSPQLSNTPGREKRINAVVMGRKTWDSIPNKFRPLKDRMNVVVTRDAGSEKWTALQKSVEEGPIVAPSIAAAIEALRSEEVEKSGVRIEKVFVIGGASIYRAALELPQTERVLLTKIKREYECDTFFPVDLDGAVGWRKAGRDALQEFVGEEIKEGGVEEKGVQFEFCLYEKEGVEAVI